MRKESPIPFNAPMVRAILDGSKTQTRRVVKPQPFAGDHYQGDICFDGFRIPREGGAAPAKFSAEAVGGGAYMDMEVFCPYGQPGDRLWVSESGWVFGLWHQDGETRKGRASWRLELIGQRVTYSQPATDELTYWGSDRPGFVHRPSIHMPRWASRILLEIVAVRVERLQDINEGDVIREGCPNEILYGRGWYRHLWEDINGADSWEANPWVWVVEFKRVVP